MHAARLQSLPRPNARWLPALAAWLVLTLVAGCGYPETQPMNMEIITSLRTACSARNGEWLDANEAKIEQRRASGQMRDDEYEAFMEIVRQARGGDWAGAEGACLKFQNSQRPTDEQVAKIRAFHAK
ncbi:MAG: hypothetical protein DWQ37_10435 [Planctomycetota bacterium]|nr:MAG: hypothetical protein DWQ37_10435 [Planctomycetota bacterium]